MTHYTTTGADGRYHFTGPTGSDEDGHTLRELPAQEVLAEYLDGLGSAGSTGGDVDDDEASGIVLNVNTSGSGYDLAEVCWA